MVKSRLYLGLFSILFFLLSCGENELPESCDNCGFQCLTGEEKKLINNGCLWYDDCSFNYYRNSNIDLSGESSIQDGDKNVFEFKTMDTEVAGIRPEIKNTLLFETDPLDKTFWVNGNDFKKLNVHFKRTCTCGNVELSPAKSGCIAGEEQAPGVWFMFGKAIVTTPNGDEEVAFEARFNRVN
ncbi:hypothetical protein [Jiulongibacter sp. NS-SX5]|uniref:hypothetical protein n=1 Tax=Jiulongibacter sp. NS-SX5 TaxID=3463854 RepID=UPI004058627A